MEPSTYQINNIPPSERLRDARNNVPNAGGEAECQDCSEVVSNTKQENRFDSYDVGCTHCGHSIVKKQAIQGI